MQPAVEDRSGSSVVPIRRPNSHVRHPSRPKEGTGAAATHRPAVSSLLSATVTVMMPSLSHADDESQSTFELAVASIQVDTSPLA
ncbi:hypothetical protein CBOM_07915 [Ceraceosorus bombacis]|uniref:Uncharacterized protein n=1 Tax=Ceraceosorus bombacis TaxID=401625 RepID=A0A0P1BQ61_9BASI|nr:hypothetical protein CBOM_07915 [Ceraceosorus bombacis]